MSRGAGVPELVSTLGLESWFRVGEKNLQCWVRMRVASWVEEGWLVWFCVLGWVGEAYQENP